MSGLEVRVDGALQPAALDVNVASNADGSDSLDFTLPFTPDFGAPIRVEYEGKTIFSGMVTSTIISSGSGTTHVMGSSGWTIVPPVLLSKASARTVSDTLIESIVRGVTDGA